MIAEKRIYSSEMRPSASGPNRKYYFLTENGANELEWITKEWMLIANPVSNLLNRGEKQ